MRLLNSPIGLVVPQGWQSHRAGNDRAAAVKVDDEESSRITPRTETRRHPYSPVSAAMAAAALALTTACKSYIVAEGLWRLLAASVAIFTTAIHGKNARSSGKIAKKQPFFQSVLECFNECFRVLLCDYILDMILILINCGDLGLPHQALQKTVIQTKSGIWDWT